VLTVSGGGVTIEQDEEAGAQKNFRGGGKLGKSGPEFRGFRWSWVRVPGKWGWHVQLALTWQRCLLTQPPLRVTRGHPLRHEIRVSKLERLVLDYYKLKARRALEEDLKEGTGVVEPGEGESGNEITY